MARQGVACEAPSASVQMAVAPLQLHSLLVAVAWLGVELSEGLRQQGQALGLRVGVSVAKAADVGRR
jgi:hypothetical protein